MVNLDSYTYFIQRTPSSGLVELEDYHAIRFVQEKNKIGKMKVTATLLSEAQKDALGQQDGTHIGSMLVIKDAAATTEIERYRIRQVNQEEYTEFYNIMASQIAIDLFDREVSSRREYPTSGATKVASVLWDIVGSSATIRVTNALRLIAVAPWRAEPGPIINILSTLADVVDADWYVDWDSTNNKPRFNLVAAVDEHGNTTTLYQYSSQANAEADTTPTATAVDRFINRRTNVTSGKNYLPKLKDDVFEIRRLDDDERIFNDIQAFGVVAGFNSPRCRIYESTLSIGKLSAALSEETPTTATDIVITVTGIDAAGAFTATGRNFGSLGHPVVIAGNEALKLVSVGALASGSQTLTVRRFKLPNAILTGTEVSIPDALLDLDYSSAFLSLTGSGTYKHSAGVVVYQLINDASLGGADNPETGTSIKKFGRRQVTLNKPEIIDQDTIDLLCKQAYFTYRVPKRRIEFFTYDQTTLAAPGDKIDFTREVIDSSFLVGWWKLGETTGTDGANLVANPGFETYTTSPGVPDSWAVGFGSGANLSKETVNVDAGSNALKITMPVAPAAQGVKQTIALTGAKSYFFSAKYKQSTVSARPLLRVRNTTDAVDIDVRPSAYVVTNYQFLSMSFLAIAGKSYDFQLIAEASTAGDVVYWDTVSVQEIQAKDSSGNSNHGTLKAGTNTAGPTIGAAGKIGTAYDFDGVDDFVEVPDSTSLKSFPVGLTLEAWVKPDAVSTLQGIITKMSGTTGVSRAGYEIDLNATNLSVEVADGVNGFTLAAGGLVAGVFQHIVMTWEPNLTKIYLDGVLIGTDTTTAATIGQSSQAVFVGTRTGNPAHRLNGIIDEPRVYNRALTAAEVATRFNGGEVAFTDELETASIGYIVEKAEYSGDDDGTFFTLNENRLYFYDSVSELTKDVEVANAYGQGSNTLDTVNVADNIKDTTVPLIMRPFVPAEVKAINAMLLTLDVQAARSYSGAQTAAGGTGAGNDHTHTAQVTNTDGGGNTASITIPGAGLDVICAASRSLSAGDAGTVFVFDSTTVTFIQRDTGSYEGLMLKVDVDTDAGVEDYKTQVKVFESGNPVGLLLNDMFTARMVGSDPIGHEGYGWVFIPSAFLKLISTSIDNVNKFEIRVEKPDVQPRFVTVFVEAYMVPKHVHDRGNHSHGINIGFSGFHSHPVTMDPHTHPADIAQQHVNTMKLDLFIDGPTAISRGIKTDGTLVGAGLGDNFSSDGTGGQATSISAPIDILPLVLASYGASIRGKFLKIRIQSPTAGKVARIDSSLVSQLFVGTSKKVAKQAFAA